MSKLNRYQILMQFPEGDLLVLWYKLSKHQIPPPGADAHWFAVRLEMFMDFAFERITGHTIPADLNLLDDVKAFK